MTQIVVGILCYSVFSVDYLGDIPTRVILVEVGGLGEFVPCFITYRRNALFDLTRGGRIGSVSVCIRKLLIESLFPVIMITYNLFTVRIFDVQNTFTLFEYTNFFFVDIF